MMASASTTKPTNRSVKTCTECKQVKLRCDSKAKFPAPCSRCEARQLYCTIDSSFRRLPARRRVEQMARELEDLRQRRTNDEYGRVSIVSPSTGDGLHSSPSDSIQPTKAAEFDYSRLDEYDVFTLDNVTVDRESVLAQLQIFSAFYYPHFPVMDSTAAIIELYESSAVLFWTMVMVVAGREVVPSSRNLLVRLREPYDDLVRRIATKPPLSLHTIQALEYCIMWPMPAIRQVHDPSWLYCGLAMNASLYSGLHTYKRPLQSLRSIGVNVGSSATRGNTWLGCFLCSTTHSMLKGVPPMVTTHTDLDVIERLARERLLPQEFTHQVMVQHCFAKFTHVLADSGNTLSYSLVHLAETEMDTVKTRFPVQFTPRVESSFLLAKLHIYAMAILRMHNDPTSRAILLKRGLTAAVRIVYLTDQGLHYQPTDGTTIELTHLSRTIPKYYWLGLAFACVFLLRYFALNSQALPDEQELARNHVALAHKSFLLGAPDNPRDERGRAAKFLQVLSRQNPVNPDSTKLRVDDKMGPSLLYDAITKGDEIRNRNLEAVLEPENGHLEDEEENSNADIVSEKAAAVPSNEQPIQQEYITAPPTTYESFGFDAGFAMAYDPMEFQFPDDLWGNEIWNVFDSGLNELSNMNDLYPYDATGP